MSLYERRDYLEDNIQKELIRQLENQLAEANDRINELEIELENETKRADELCDKLDNLESEVEDSENYLDTSLGYLYTICNLMPFNTSNLRLKKEHASLLPFLKSLDELLYYLADNARDDKGRMEFNINEVKFQLLGLLGNKNAN
jgi:chromosome segregation ATPase